MVPSVGVDRRGHAFRRRGIPIGTSRGDPRCSTSPVRVNNVNLAQNPVTGELKPQVYVGSFVPNTGDPYNGMVTNDEWPTYGIGFRVSQGIQPEGRVGVAWDITGQRQDVAAREPRPLPQRIRQRQRARHPGSAATSAEQPDPALLHHRFDADARGPSGV